MSGAIDSVSGGMQYSPVQKAKTGSEIAEQDGDKKKGVLGQMREDTVDISEEARKLSEEKRKIDREKEALEERSQAEKAEEKRNPEDEGSWAVTEVDGDPNDPSTWTTRVLAQGKGQLPAGY